MLVILNVSEGPLPARSLSDYRAWARSRGPLAPLGMTTRLRALDSLGQLTQLAAIHCCLDEFAPA